MGFGKRIMYGKTTLETILFCSKIYSSPHSGGSPDPPTTTNTLLIQHQTALHY